MTAAEAKKLTEEAKEKQIPLRREKVLAQIKAACSQGESYLYFGIIPVHKEDHEWLRSLGYKVEPSVAAFGGYIYGSVSW